MGKKRIYREKFEDVLKEQATVEEAVGRRIVTETKPPAEAVRRARIYIHSSFNNIIVSLTNKDGEVLAQSSAGALGFRGPKKATAYAASKVAEVISTRLKGARMDEVEIFVRGVGPGSDAAVRSFVAQDLPIVRIRDITPVPHGGVRPPKVRRV